MHVAVLGGGICGLALTYELQQLDCEVSLFEAADQLGGLGSTFEFGDIRAERFYHFICRPDTDYLDQLARFGLKDRIEWVTARMGNYVEGRIHEWGTPSSLLRYPHLSLLQKMRYGAHALRCKYSDSWSKLDDVSARRWLIRWLGESCYQHMWAPLLEDKFGQEAESISAAWLWSRIRRVARSKNLRMQDEYGYLRGGTGTLLDAYIEAIRERGANIHMNSPIARIEHADGRVRGLRVAPGASSSSASVEPATAGLLEFDAVASTLPIPIARELVDGLEAGYRHQLAQMRQVGVVCTLLKLSARLSDMFWINVHDEDAPLLGILEFTNLVSPTEFNGHHLVYLPLYLNPEDPRFSMPDDELIEHHLGMIGTLFPHFDRENVIDHRVFRAKLAQPVCFTGFRRALPPVETPVRGLFISDTSHYYPEDRSISQGIGLAKSTARMIVEQLA